MSSTNEQPSKVSAIKDQALGTIKETVGNLIGNEKMELKGKAQKVHGKNEMAYAKANKNGDAEPEHFQEAHAQPDLTQHTTEQPINHPQTTNDYPNVSQIPPQNMPVVAPPQNIEQLPSTTGVTPVPPPAPVGAPPLAPVPNQPVVTPQNSSVPPVPPQNLSVPPVPPQNSSIPPVPPTVGAAPPPPANIHEHAEGSVEGDSVSMLGALKDKTLGSIKQTLGSATGNQNMELQGMAQNIHGHHQDEFAKAQKQGLNEPAHFEKGTKVLDQPTQGSLEGQDKPSSLNAMKDQTMGSIKQNYGSATGNMGTEIAGAAQKMHGKNEAEFAKAEKQGLSEPAHYERGTNNSETTQGEVIGENEPSKMSGYKDQAVGSMKEKWGSATGNQNMEIAGKAQKMHGSNQTSLADQNNNSTINA